MRHLNYHHLLYFWTVAHQGSIARAAEVLFLTPQTISSQLKQLEQAVGDDLFERVGRRLTLTDTGALVLKYADEIFSLGGELSELVRSKSFSGPPLLRVGVNDSVPKLVAYNVIAPALAVEDVRIVCREQDLESLLAELAVHRLDLIISDSPLPRGLHVRAYNHLLGETAVTFFAAPKLARRVRGRFPADLADEPFLLPAPGSTLRRALDEWFHTLGVSPRVVAEFDDSALMKSFGREGAGVFPGPSVIAREISAMYGVRAIGRVDEIVERFYIISPERKIKNRAVVAIRDGVDANLFG